MAMNLNSYPMNKTQRYRCFLPLSSKDNKNGTGVLLFLMSKDISDAIYMINSTSNMIDKSKVYRRYYIPLRIKGMLGTKHINYYNPTLRKDEYGVIKKKCPKIKETPMQNLDTNPSAKNCYFGMHNYITLFNQVTSKMNIGRRISIFWSFMDLIWHSKQTSQYSEKYVMVDLDAIQGWTGKPNVDINNLSYMIYHSLYRYPQFIPNTLQDITFVLYTSTSFLKINIVDLKNLKGSSGKDLYKREVIKLMKTSKQRSRINSEEKEDAQAIYDEVKAHLAQRYRFIGDAEDSIDEDDIETIASSEDANTDEEFISKRIDEITDDIIEDVTEDNESVDSKIESVDSLIEDRIDEDKELIDAMYTVAQKQKMPSKPASSARDKMLLEKQKDILVKGMKLEDINKIKASEVVIPENDITNQVQSSNDHVKHIKYANFDKTYIEQIMKKDLANTFECLNDKTIPMYIRDIDVSDTSTPTDLKETWTVSLEDANRQRHTIKVDIPKFIDNRFMYIGGNKVIILKQNFLYPVVKTGPATVQIVTNYNKMFITRYDKKNTTAIERFMLLLKAKPELIGKNVVLGNVSPTNTNYVTTIELDQLARLYSSCKFNSLHLEFSIDVANRVAKISNPDPKFPCIGVNDNKPVLVDVETGFIKGTDKTIMEYIESNMSNDCREAYEMIKVPKNTSYSLCKIMAQWIPMISLLGYWEGLSTVLKKANITITTTDKRPRLTSKQGAIQFNDCWMVYDDVLDKGLLVNGLKKLDTEKYSIADFDGPEPYVNYFTKKYGKQAVINTLINAYDFMIDPITLEVLGDIGLPKDLVELCIYANSLLADNNFKQETDQSIYRIRSNEIIAGILYKEISNSYINYRNSNGKKKLSLPKDAVIKHLLSIPTVKDYSTLNPGIDITDSRTISPKGFVGSNLSRSYSIKRRGYNETMRGIVVPVTSNDGNVGVNRFLAYEPNILNARGYCKIVESEDELNDVNMQTADDMIYPLTETRDDALRTAMTIKQTNHMVPTKHMCPVLIGNGAEETVRFNLSSDFAVNAEEDGVVKDYDEKNHIMVVEYKSGKRRIIDLGSNMSKNGGGGFYMKQQKTTNLRAGDKFKKNQCLAWHKDYFSYDPIFGPRINAGTLVKMAITTADCTYEDSAMVTNKIADEMTTAVTFKKGIVIGKNANLEYMVNIGDHVDIGDVICQYDTSYEDSELNKLLKNISDDLKEEVLTNTKNTIKAKHVGEVVDIKVYSPVDLEEMSPSLQKYCSKYYNKIKNKYNKIKSFANNDEEKKSSYCCDYLMNETTGKIEPNKFGVIRGEKVNNDSILIEVYVEHSDVVGVGDKLTVYGALKATVGTVVPAGLEPYSDYRPDEELSYILASNSVLKRMVSSVPLTMLGNKVLVELKRKLKDIYDSNI